MKKAIALFSAFLLALNLFVFTSSAVETNNRINLYSAFAARAAANISSPARFIGDIGCVFTVKDTDIELTHLGAPYINSNTKSTLVTVYEVSTAYTTTISPTNLIKKAEQTVTLDATKKDFNNFCYEPLAATVVLSKGKDYVITLNTNVQNYNAFYELILGDCTSPAVEIKKEVFAIGTNNKIADGATINIGTFVGTSFGAPTFLYREKETLGTYEAENEKSTFIDFSREIRRLSSPSRFLGEIGYYFNTDDYGIEITKLGAPSVKGASSTVVTIYEANTSPVNNLLTASQLSVKAQATVAIDVSKRDIQGFNYATLPSPVKLDANKSYYITVLSSSSTYNCFYEADILENTNKEIIIKKPVFVVGGQNTISTNGSLNIGTNVDNSAFGVPSFIYKSLAPQQAVYDDTSAFLTFEKANRELSSPARFIGELGYMFKTGSYDYDLTALGAPYQSTATETMVSLYELNTALPDGITITPSMLTKIASAKVIIDENAKDSQGFNYTPLPNSIKLQKNKFYVLTMTTSANKYNMFYETNTIPDKLQKGLSIYSPVYAFKADTDNTVSGGADIIFVNGAAQEGRAFGVPSFKLLKSSLPAEIPTTGDNSIYVFSLFTGSVLLLCVFTLKKSQKV